MRTFSANNNSLGRVFFLVTALFLLPGKGAVYSSALVISTLEAPGHSNPFSVELMINGFALDQGLVVDVTVRYFTDHANPLGRPKTLYHAVETIQENSNRATKLMLPGHVFQLPGRYLITAMSDGLSEAAFAEVHVEGLSMAVSAPESVSVGQTVTVAAELANSLNRALAVSRIAVALPEGMVALSSMESHNRRIDANDTLRFEFDARIEAPGWHTITAVAQSAAGDFSGQTTLAAVRPAKLELLPDPPQTLSQNLSGQLAVTLLNNGDVPMETIEVRLGGENSLKISPQRQVVDRLDGLAAMPLSWTVRSDGAAPGRYSLQAVASTADGAKTETELAVVVIGSLASVDPQALPSLSAPAVAVDSGQPTFSPVTPVSKKQPVTSDAQIDAMIAQGQALYRNSEYDQAIRLFDRVLALRPNHVLALYERGRAHDKAGHPKQLFSDLNRALEIDPDHVDALCYRSASHKESGDLQRAVEDADRAIRANPSAACGYAERGNARLRLGKTIKKDVGAQKKYYREAVADFTQAIQNRHRFPDKLYNNRGAAYGSMEDYEKAIENYSQAIEIKADNPLYFSNRGFCYRKTKRYQKALQDFNRALSLDPKRSMDYAQRAYVYRNLKQYEKAIDGFSRAIDGNVKEDWIYANRGSCYLNTKKYAAAVRDYSIAIEMDSRYEYAIANRGQAYLNMGNCQKALADFSRAVKLDPKDAWNVAHRGEAYRQLGQYEAAKRDFKTALKLDPDYAWARKKLKSIQSDQAVGKTIDMIDAIIRKQLKNKL